MRLIRNQTYKQCSIGLIILGTLNSEPFKIWGLVGCESKLTYFFDSSYH